jgi:hypothetical protein
MIGRGHNRFAARSLNHIEYSFVVRGHEDL